MFLSILARLLFTIVGFINPILVMFKYVKRNGFWNVFTDYWLQDAREVDIFGNYTYRTTWNMLFGRKGGYRYGRRGETISSALGKNEFYNSCSVVGYVMVYMLWFIDYKYWFSGGHCYNSIEFEFIAHRTEMDESRWRKYLGLGIVIFIWGTIYGSIIWKFYNWMID